MFELAIFFVIVIAAAYWTVLWSMGRREDVLHGQFVQSDRRSGETASSVLPKAVLPAPFPQKRIPKSLVPKSRLPNSRLPERSGAGSNLPQPVAFRPERLQSLLSSIKRDLDQLAPK